jgi:NAD(P)-dependent dehydrogenase (short-subunit alcohol dehydrogenase family)
MGHDMADEIDLTDGADGPPLVTSAFGARTTADEVLAGRDLRGQRFLVTGGYAGLGMETCRALATAGAHVIVAGRDLYRAGAAAVELRGLGAGDVEPLELDLSDQDAITDAVARLGDVAIHAIIANAGVMACPLRRSDQGWEWQLAVNVLGHARLTWLLVPALRRAEGPTRLVMLSSTGHHLSPFIADDPHFRDRSYDKWQAYGQSKTADSLFAVAFQRAALVEGLDAFAVHPGGIMTSLQRHLPHDEMVAMGWIDDSGASTHPAFKTPMQGASTQVWAATAPELQDAGGRYLEDCAEAVPAVQGVYGVGVKPYAVDAEAASELWGWCERELRLAAPT